MDFRSPPAVLEALHSHIDHGVFGYTLPPQELMDTIIEMLEKVHAWKVRPEWLVWLPGLVSGLNIACRSIGAAGDSVMTTIPAYPPFLTAPILSQRRLITVAHTDDGNRYVFDFDEMRRSIAPDTRLFVLCNPHNPTGRVFTHEELSGLRRICLEHGIVICSDEIHCGLVLDEDRPHISIAAMDPDASGSSITLLAPSKTFNLPGLGCSFAVIPNGSIRRSFKDTMQGIVPHVNALGYTAALAAYRHCEDWRHALIEYLRANRDLLRDFFAHVPGLTMRHIEATYLAWIDCRDLGLRDPALFFEESGVGLSSGTDFGVPGFVRLNFGCPRSLLSEALDRMSKAVHNL